MQINLRHATAIVWQQLLAIAVAVGALDWLSLSLSRSVEHVATIWPSRGIVLAFCIIAGSRARLPVLFAALAGGIVARMAFGETFGGSLYLAVVANGCVLLADWLLRRRVGRKLDFRTWRHLATFLAIATFAAALAAFPGAGFSWLTHGAKFASKWPIWWLAGTLSYTIFTPLVVLLATVNFPSRKTIWQKRKLAATSAGMLAVLFTVFAQSAFPVTYLVPIALMAVTMIAEIEGTIIGLLLTTVVAIGFTAHGCGPATLAPGTTAQHVVIVQFFLGVLCIGLLPIAAAITERRTLRDELQIALARAQDAAADAKESEARYRLLAERSRDIIVRADLAGRIRYVSSSCRAMGYQPEELAGVDSTELVHPDDREKFVADNAAFVSGNSAHAVLSRQHRFRTKQGEWVWLEGNPAVLHDRNGKPVEVLNVLRNVSERKAIEAELIVARERAEGAAAAKAEFLANMSHEIRTPLTGVVGFADLLNEQCDLDDRAKHFATRIRSGGAALLATINAILDFSKLESGRMELASFPTDVREIADDVMALLQLKANQKGVRLTAQYAIEPDLCVMIDPQRLRQLLLNLIGNAVKFTDTGSVTLTMSYDEATDPGLLRCEVADTGCGIPRDRKDDLFQRFSQIDGSTTRNHGGTGLGLAICKGIVQMMEGHIGVYSDAGEGATFWFEVPADRIAAPQTQRTVFSQPDEGHRARVLAVDDNEDTRDLLRNALPREVADLTLAESGEQALALAAQMPFDLILMDIQMSGMDGIATMRAIKDAGGPNAGCPIVAFTAMAAGERLAQLVAEGFDGTLSKPLVLNDLLACVRRYTTPGGIAIEPKARDAA